MAAARFFLLRLREQAGVDRKRDPGDVARLVGGEPHQCVADVDRLHPGNLELVAPGAVRDDVLLWLTTPPLLAA